MRIISGKYKGKAFHPPKNFNARPTTDFAKEALFNVLQHRIDFEGLDVLDLFAGTGSISYEFVSRGVTSVAAIDRNFNHVKFIKAMDKTLDENIKVLKADVFKFLKNPPEKTFDIIFADPPYALENIREIATLVFKHKWLNPDGLLIIEHGVQSNLSDLPNFVEHKKNGNVHFSFFEN